MRLKSLCRIISSKDISKPPTAHISILINLLARNTIDYQLHWKKDQNCYIPLRSTPQFFQPINAALFALLHQQSKFSPCTTSCCAWQGKRQLILTFPFPLPYPVGATIERQRKNPGAPPIVRGCLYLK